MSGSFVLMLHSHLPFYRKAGMWPFGEENLYECMVETYLPLLNALTELQADGIAAHITVGITPVLAEQLADEHLKQGFETYLQRQIDMAEADVARYPDPDVPHSDHLAFLAGYYRDHFKSLMDDFRSKYQRDVIGAFRKLQDAGCIEITTSAATHGFLPLLATDEAIEGQLKTGIEAYKKYFGRDPKGIWLPECAYRHRRAVNPVNGEVTVRPPIEAFLFENGLQYFFTEYSAIEGSEGSEYRRHVGIYRDIKQVPMHHKSLTGLTTDQPYYLKDYPVAVLGRNERASFQVWSAADGYPGDGIYREFHKKDETSGLQYWRITAKDRGFGDKMLYDPVEAFNKTREHAKHYVWLIEQMLAEKEDDSMIMVSFDTELFGHWWYEGIAWLKEVIRGLHASKAVHVRTASEQLATQAPEAALQLPDSTWGAGGHYWVWNNEEHTHWMWSIIHECEYFMRQLVRAFINEKDPLKVRILNQTFRELLLLQSSDWPFLITTGQARQYAIDRFNTHVANFNSLAVMLTGGTVDEELLSRLEEQNNLFAGVDYHWYQYHPDAAEAHTPGAQLV
ncbi:MAG: glycoside hydrolase family 57 protein [Candidatus Melainabacteria bacterium]